jgi:protein-S-isoprenylcysteine O-methyltransferase Ste14
MYVGLILMYLGAPFILGSLWSLAVGGVIWALTIWRTAMEDRTLRSELAGYEEFTSQTRYRLVPGVW